MGRRGPQPRPAAAAILAGETRPSRVNYDEPLPRQGYPTMPRGMSARAQAEWRHVEREMSETGVIVGADRAVLRAYCEAVARYVEAVDLLATSGPVIRGTRGRDVVVNPVHRILREEREAVRLLARELGLSPSARAGLRISMGRDQGDLDSVLPPAPKLRVVGGEDED